MHTSLAPHLARLRLLAVRRVLDENVAPEEIVEAARKASVAGAESFWLVALAGILPDELDQAPATLLKLAEELGWEPELSLDPVATRWELVRHWCAAISAGTCTPEEGARRIWEEGYHPLDRPGALAVFVVACDDLEEWNPDFPVSREEIVAGIVDEARALLAGPWPPR